MGQACSRVAGDGGGNFIAFDLGLPLPFQKDPLSKKEKDDIAAARRHMETTPFKAVVFSHYDYDRISGFKRLPISSIGETCWFGYDPLAFGIDPDKDLSFAARSMLAILIGYGRLRLLSGPYTFGSRSGGHIDLVPGQPCDRNCCTSRNQVGVSAAIMVHGHSALLPGDSMYRCWNPAICSRKYDLVMVPHHGADIRDCPLEGVFGKYVIFSYGTHNTYGHPTVKHVKAIQKRVGPDGVLGTPYFRWGSLVFSFIGGDYYWRW